MEGICKKQFLAIWKKTEKLLKLLHFLPKNTCVSGRPVVRYEHSSSAGCGRMSLYRWSMKLYRDRPLISREDQYIFLAEIHKKETYP